MIEKAAVPKNLLVLTNLERHGEAISFVVVDGKSVLVSSYGDDVWNIGGNTNRSKNARVLDFRVIPLAYRDAVKQAFYRYIFYGLEGSVVPKSSTVISYFQELRLFIAHLTSLKVAALADISPFTCALFVAKIRDRVYRGRTLRQSALHHRFQAVETLYHLSQYTTDRIPSHPWPGETAHAMSGGKRVGDKIRTPLIPDEVFCEIFQAAWQVVENGNQLIDWRDKAAEELAGLSKFSSTWRQEIKGKFLRKLGWKGNLHSFNEALLDIRIASYIVVASLSGCRNHELANVQNGACYSTVDDDGDTYWWMRARSQKTDEGLTEWMIPETAVVALRLMERWAAPLQAAIAEELVTRRTRDPRDTELGEAQRHLHAVFLGRDSAKEGRPVRTLSDLQCGSSLKKFCSRRGINWHLATHQFRRKFANYAARSSFGDLRYLKNHFKHWQLDTTHGYALNESQELSLYAEIQAELDDIKEGVVAGWMADDVPLAGGYGGALMAYRGNDDVKLFKSHKQMVKAIAESTSIRSNGHAWCTADDNRCIGNGALDPTRCSGCSNAVIGKSHERVYRGLYSHLESLTLCDDIGQAGLARVERDLQRCRSVLSSLGCDPAIGVVENG